jgi:hypothetical protein
MVKIKIKKGKIIEFESDAKKISDYFLYYNRVLSSVSLPSVTCIGYGFLCCNKVLTSVSLPNVEKIGHGFLFHSRVLEKLYAPKLNRDRLVNRSNIV